MTDTLNPTPEWIAAQIPSGSRVIVPKGEGRDMPMAVARELIRQGARDLRLVTLPTCAFPVSGMMADMLIGAGCVAEVETSGISLGELGAAPRFGKAVREGGVRIVDATCPALYAAVQAGAKGQPFAALRGLIGSDVERLRDDYTVIDNPFQPGDPVAVLKAINPDVAIFHAPCADREGNVWVGRNRDLINAAHASDRVFVTVDRIEDRDFYDDDVMVAGVLPSFYVEAIAEAPDAARPPGAGQGDDIAAVRAYAEAARSDEGFAAWLDAHVLAPARQAAE